MSELFHYSDKPLGPLVSRSQSRSPALKPDGLWVSVEADAGGGWREWCEAESFRLECLIARHRVELAPDARVIRIENVRVFDAFNERFGAPLSTLPHSRRYGIDWAGVARRHQGIVIAPYLWRRRMSDALWYYGWDCASGCIWDVSAIAAVELAPALEAAS